MRAVLFDMDGVLVDSEALICASARAMFRELGLTVRVEDFDPFVGAGEDRYIGGVAESYGFPIDLPKAKARTYALYLARAPFELRVFPGVRELVTACRGAGWACAVASSADRIKVEANLRVIGLPEGTWQAVLTAEDVLRRKPDPALFLAAAGRLGVPAAACTVVEDAVNGVAAAKAARMRCVAVATSFSAERLQAADCVRARLADITLADLEGTSESSPS